MSKKIVRLGADLKPKAPQQPPAQHRFVLALNIVFMDGDKPAASATLHGEMPLPEPGQGAALEVRLDARQLLSQLEAQLGPSKAKLWTPGG